MPILGNLYLWGAKAKGVPKETGVYAFYDENRKLIYLGGSSDLRETFTQYLETNFSDDPRKRETTYYRRMNAKNWEETVKCLLAEYKKDCGDLPKLNIPVEQDETVTSEWGFYFYETFDKPLFEAAFNIEDLKKKAAIVSTDSLEFHQRRGDFARWIRDVFKETQLADRIAAIDSTGEALRAELLNALGNPDVAECPDCESLTLLSKSWEMTGRPTKSGERLKLTIGLYKCDGCGKTFRKALKKEKVKA
ncbi:MAG: hypothetical protein ACOWW1_00825 [archaeon]